MRVKQGLGQRRKEAYQGFSEIEGGKKLTNGSFRVNFLTLRQHYSTIDNDILSSDKVRGC